MLIIIISQGSSAGQRGSEAEEEVRCVTGEREEKKEYLEQTKYIRIRIKDKQLLIKQLKIDWQCPSAMNMEQVRSGNGVKDTSNYATALEKLEEEVKQIECELLAAEKERLHAINLLPHKYATILEKRYVHGKSFNRIGEEVGYEKSNVYEMHNKALDLFQIPNK